MDRQLIRFAAMTLVSVLWSSSAVRAECPAFTLEQKFKDSAAVFVGRVVGMKTLREPQRLRQPNSLITFAVDDLWKGPVGKDQMIYSTATGTKATIVTCGRVIDGVATCIDLRFELNTKFVVFADKDGISMCAPTARVDQAIRTLRWLANKPHTTAKDSKNGRKWLGGRDSPGASFVRLRILADYR